MEGGREGGREGGLRWRRDGDFIGAPSGRKRDVGYSPEVDSPGSSVSQKRLLQLETLLWMDLRAVLAPVTASADFSP